MLDARQPAFAPRQVVSTSPEPIAFSGMAALGSKLYITGGCQVRAAPPADRACLRRRQPYRGWARQNGDGTIPNDRSDQQQLWVFDTADASWAVGPPMLRARQECAAVTLGSCCILAGGRRHSFVCPARTRKVGGCEEDGALMLDHSELPHDTRP